MDREGIVSDDPEARRTMRPERGGYVDGLACDACGEPADGDATFTLLGPDGPALQSRVICEKCQRGDR